MPGRSHPPAKLQAETPLTPARSFRDEDLTPLSSGNARTIIVVRAFLDCVV